MFSFQVADAVNAAVELWVKLFTFWIVCFIIWLPVMLILRNRRWAYCQLTQFWATVILGTITSLVLSSLFACDSMGRVYIQVNAVLLSIISLIFVYLPAILHRYRYNSAWPDNLENLLQNFTYGKGMRLSLMVVGLYVFTSSLFYITTLYSAIASLLIGIALLELIKFDYHQDTALLGMVLLSLSVVSLFVNICLRLIPYTIPGVLNLIMIILSYLSFHWSWLGRVWETQIVDKKPITTTAKLVYLTRHISIMLIGFASLLSLKLSVWPLLSIVDNWDNSFDRLVLIVIGYTVLILSNLWLSKRFKSFSLSVLTVVNIFCGVTAVIVRLPRAFEQYFLPNLEYVLIAFIISLVMLVVVFYLNGVRGNEKG